MSYTATERSLKQSFILSISTAASFEKNMSLYSVKCEEIKNHLKHLN